MNLNSIWIRILAIVSAGLVIGALLLAQTRVIQASELSLLTFASIAFASGALASVFLDRRKPIPDSVSISLVGPSRVGKTVFISISLDQFLTAPEASPIRLLPYGAETTEAIDSVVAQIRSGHWPPPTPSGKWFEYKARVSVRKGAYRGRSPPKLNVGDFPGEDIRQLVPGTPQWLHKSTAFRYVIDSDAVFFVIDAGFLVRSAVSELAHYDATYKAALQVLYEEKVASDVKMEMPVGVILTKTDLLPHADGAIPSSQVDSALYSARVTRQLTGLVEEKLPGFSALLRNLCRTTSIFPVSSVGSVRKDGGPPTQLKPVGIRAPWEWALRELLPDLPKEQTQEN